MARKISPSRKTTITIIAWAIGLMMFFPILWTVLTSFKTEADAIASPPSFIAFEWTLENYFEVQERSNYFRHFGNSVIISLGSTILGLLIAIPLVFAYTMCREWVTKFELDLQRAAQAALNMLPQMTKTP